MAEEAPENELVRLHLTEGLCFNRHPSIHPFCIVFFVYESCES